MNLRPTQAVIRLDNLRHNARQILSRLPPHCKALGMVKADAYGHGAVPVAKTLADCGFAAFGVATAEEGIELRTAGLKNPILVMGGTWGLGKPALEMMAEADLTPVVHSPEIVSLLHEIGKARKTTLKAHLKIDTGMGRLGVTLQALPQVLEVWRQSPHVTLEGVMTHLAFRSDPDYTRYQMEQFKTAANRIQTALGKVPVWHVANSASIIAGEPIGFDFSGEYWVRPGIMLYGVPPYPQWSQQFDLRPVLRLESKIALIKQVPAGTKISYNGTFVTGRASRIAVIPIGYADGYPWTCAGKGQVLIGGGRAPVVGRVTMDMIMVDVTETKTKVGDAVVLLGEQGDETITADEIATQAGTISYEILCRVSKRLPRGFI